MLFINVFSLDVLRLSLKKDFTIFYLLFKQIKKIVRVVWCFCSWKFCLKQSEKTYNLSWLQTHCVLDAKCLFCRFLFQQEWDNFLQDLYDAVQQQLNESHVHHFTDLSNAERYLFIEKATRAISDSQWPFLDFCYSSFYILFSTSLMTFVQKFWLSSFLKMVVTRGLPGGLQISKIGDSQSLLFQNSSQISEMKFI